MPSINVDLNFFSHRKAIRLSGQLGDQAITCLLRLWCYVGQHDPEFGSLGDMLDYEIEHVSNWRGDQGVFVRALISIGLLDIIDGKAFVHGWTEHARHLIVYRNRAKRAAAVKWEAHQNKSASCNASSMLQADSLVEKSISYASSIASSNAKDALSIVPIQYNTIHSNTKKEEVARVVSKKPTKPILADTEWLEELQKNPAYAHIDFIVQNGKMDAWLSLPQNKNRIKSRKFILNWLNRIEKPVQQNVEPGKSYTGTYHKKVQL